MSKITSGPCLPDYTTVLNWKIDDTIRWLEENKLKDFIDIFRSRNIDGKALLELDQKRIIFEFVSVTIKMRSQLAKCVNDCKTQAGHVKRQLSKCISDCKVQASQYKNSVKRQSQRMSKRIIMKPEGNSNVLHDSEDNDIDYWGSDFSSGKENDSDKDDSDEDENASHFASNIINEEASVGMKPQFNQGVFQQTWNVSSEGEDLNKNDNTSQGSGVVLMNIKPVQEPWTKPLPGFSGSSKPVAPQKPIPKPPNDFFWLPGGTSNVLRKTSRDYDRPCELQAQPPPTSVSSKPTQPPVLTAMDACCLVRPSENEVDFEDYEVPLELLGSVPRQLHLNGILHSEQETVDNCHDEQYEPIKTPEEEEDNIGHIRITENFEKTKAFAEPPLSLKPASISSFAVKTEQPITAPSLRAFTQSGKGYPIPSPDPVVDSPGTRFANDNSFAGLTLEDHLQQDGHLLSDALKSPNSFNERQAKLGNAIISVQATGRPGNIFPDKRMSPALSAKSVNSARPLPTLPSPSNDYQDLDAQPYFHRIDRKEAERRVLALQKNGAFLVRPSQNGGAENPYTLTLVEGSKVIHLNVRQKGQEYALGKYKDNEKTFQSVEAMINHHRHNPVFVSSQEWKVKECYLKYIPPK